MEFRAPCVLASREKEVCSETVGTSVSNTQRRQRSEGMTAESESHVLKPQLVTSVSFGESRGHSLKEEAMKSRSHRDRQLGLVPLSPQERKA